MKCRISQFILSICLLVFNSFIVTAQDQTEKAGSPRSPQTSDESETKPAMSFGLEDGTVVKLRLVRDLFSSQVEDEEMIDFEVIEDVKVDGVIVIARGAKAEGTIVEAKAARRMGRSGRIGVRLDWAHMVSGKRAPIRAISARSNGSRVGGVARDMTVAAAFFFPAAPFFLLKKGKEMKIPKGTLMTAFIDGDVPLDRKKFE
jgi:hypothetical protein